MRMLSLYAGFVRRSAATAAVVGLCCLPGSARADIAPKLAADMRCVVERTAVVCRVTAKASIQSHLTYARADVVRAPPFLKVLRGSVDFSDGRDQQPKLNLAFVAEHAGEGDIIVKVQGMVCADDGSSCPALSRAVVARVKVGP